MTSIIVRAVLPRSSCCQLTEIDRRNGGWQWCNKLTSIPVCPGILKRQFSDFLSPQSGIRECEDVFYCSVFLVNNFSQNCRYMKQAFCINPETLWEPVEKIIYLSIYVMFCLIWFGKLCFITVFYVWFFVLIFLPLLSKYSCKNSVSSNQSHCLL